MMRIPVKVSKWLSERTRGALKQRKAAGLVYGAVPFGYRREGERLVVDDEQQLEIRRMREARAQGASFRAIADSLNERGVQTARCGHWHAKTVRDLVRRKEEA